MQDPSLKGLSSRLVAPEETRWLHVEAGWYVTKISGTFVSGPHKTQEEAQSKIDELDPPPPLKRSF